MSEDGDLPDGRTVPHGPTGDAPPASPFGVGSPEAMDRDLAAAIEASFRTQPGSGMNPVEDDMLEQALRISRMEEEERLRQAAPGEGADPPQGVPAEDTLGGLGGIPPGLIGEDTFGFAARPGPAPGPTEDLDGSVSPRLLVGEDDTMNDSMNDPHLAMALEASYASQTATGMQASEDDLLAQAILVSQREEESRQRAVLREQQEEELQESMLMDQMREEQAKARQVEEEQLRVLEEQRLAEEEQRRQQEQARAAEELRAKSSRVPPEPPADEPGRVDLQIRLPDGQRLRRAFPGASTLGQVYDHVDVSCGEQLIGRSYRLVSTFPRRLFEDREQNLEAAGLQGQCSLILEVIQSD